MGRLKSRRAPLKSPLHASFWIVHDCNLRCRYCYAAPFTGERMETGRLLQVIDELAELEVPDITLSGGEPFLHPDILTIIGHLLHRKLRPAVLSNGTLLTGPTIAALDRLVPEKRDLLLQISLDSPESTVNDLTRGAGRVVMENLHLLARQGFQLQVSTVLSRHNIDSAHRIIETLYPLVKRFHFLCIQRTREALRHADILVDQRRLDEFWWHLKEYAAAFPGDLFIPSLRIALRASRLEDSPADRSFHQQATFDAPSCTAGLTHVNIDSAFHVLGCDIAKDHTHMGNIRNRPFSEVWHSRAAHMVRNSPFPPCYRIRDERGQSLLDRLKPEYRQPAPPVGP